MKKHRAIKQTGKSIQSNSEHANTVIWWYVNFQELEIPRELEMFKVSKECWLVQDLAGAQIWRGDCSEIGRH